MPFEDQGLFDTKLKVSDCVADLKGPKRLYSRWV